MMGWNGANDKKLEEKKMRGGSDLGLKEEMNDMSLLIAHLRKLRSSQISELDMLLSVFFVSVYI